MDNEWTWARLNRDQLGLLREAEETLGADILMAYRQGERAEVKADVLAQTKLQAADLNESQLECLQGLERQLDSVVIAYQQGG